MRLAPTLRAVADRLGLDPTSYSGPDGRPRPRLLWVAAALSLFLWSAFGWGVSRLVGWLARS